MSSQEQLEGLQIFQDNENQEITNLFRKQKKSKTWIYKMSILFIWIIPQFQFLYSSQDMFLGRSPINCCLYGRSEKIFIKNCYMRYQMGIMEDPYVSLVDCIQINRSEYLNIQIIYPILMWGCFALSFIFSTAIYYEVRNLQNLLLRLAAVRIFVKKPSLFRTISQPYILCIFLLYFITLISMYVCKYVGEVTQHPIKIKDGYAIISVTNYDNPVEYFLSEENMSLSLILVMVCIKLIFFLKSPFDRYYDCSLELINVLSKDYEIAQQLLKNSILINIGDLYKHMNLARDTKFKDKNERFGCIAGIIYQEFSNKIELKSTQVNDYTSEQILSSHTQIQVKQKLNEI